MQDKHAKKRAQQAIEMLGSAIDVKISELTESNRQLRRKIFDLHTIFEITRDFNSVLDYRTLVDSFLFTSLGQVGGSSAALYLPPSSNAECFILESNKGLSASDENKEIAFDSELCMALSAASKPLSVAELRRRIDNSGQFLPLSSSDNALLIPLIFKDELKGILALGDKIAGEAYSTDDVEFLSVLANQFAVALENARLYESERNALRELRHLQKQLILTERQAALGELSARIAHEVNNPLSIISNYLHLISRSLENPDKAAGHLDVARQELKRIANIMRQLLDFNKPQKMKMKALDVRNVIDELLTLMEWQLADKNIEVKKDCVDIPRVYASPDQLKQVFLNLIINAKDAMTNGGVLTITATTADNNVKVTFANTGPGIAPEILPRIFEPFFTTKDEEHGTGLGLSVCYGIIQEHEGRIIARNLPDKGVVFEISLPALKRTAGKTGDG